MATDFSFTITTANTSDLANYKAIPVGEAGASLDANQVARIFATAAGSGATGTSTLTFKLVDTSNSNSVVASINATLTVTTVRTASGGASGDYICTVAFPDGTDRLDLLGASGQNNSMVWYVGLSTAFPTNATSVTVYGALSPAV